MHPPPPPIPGLGSNSILLVSHTPSSRSNSPLLPPSTASNNNAAADEITDEPLQDDDWARWVENYASGKWDAEAEPPPPPAAIRKAMLAAEAAGRRSLSPSATAVDPSTSRADSGELLVYPGSQGSSADLTAPGVANSGLLLKFYQENGYFPAPKGEWEDERLATMKKYGLEEPNRRKSIERICRAAKRHFKSSTLIITLVFENHQVLVGENGWVPVDPGPDEPAARPIPYDSGFCPHNMLQMEPSSTLVVPDATKDWRFKNNPYVAGEALAFYASSNIFLAAASTQDEAQPALLPVGSICVIDSKPKAPGAFTADDKEMLRDFADMVAREFELGFEHRRRQTELKQTEYLGTFLESTLVNSEYETKPMAAPATSAIKGPAPRPKLYFYPATEELRVLSSAHSAAIFDLRSYRAPTASGGAIPMGARKQAFSAFRQGQGRIYLLGSAGDIDWEEVLAKPELKGVVSESLKQYYQDSRTDFDQSTDTSPLAAILPHPTTAQMVLPVFDVDGKPTLLIALTSSEKHFRFEEADRKFAANIGAVVVASLLRQRVLEADRAKLAFVSQISHDLRTPIHGIVSQVELIREFSSPSQLKTLAPLLDVADVCLESLRDVLDDTLDFTKFSDVSEEDQEIANKRAMRPVDLEEVAHDICKATWVRKRRTDLVHLDAHDCEAPEERQVDIIVEVEERSNKWGVEVDVSGLKRVLLNLLGNASKFTKAGSITLTIQELRGTLLSPPLISIECADTGCGMSEDFLREGGLFTPFVQEDSFSNGAGLGMSICDTIIRRMGGKIDVESVLGKGTNIRITLPVNFVQLSPQFERERSPPITPSVHTVMSADTPGRLVSFRRRVISDELREIFRPGPQNPLFTPAFETAAYDFSQAVEATQASFGSRLGRIPSKKDRSKRTVLGEKGEAQDIIHEASKLSMAIKQPATPVISPHAPYFASTTPTSVSGSYESQDGQYFAMQPPPVPPPSTRSLAPDVNCLIAEDNIIARNVLTKLLSGKGVKYTQAVDGVDALAAYQAGHYNLFLCDVQMPRMDGIECSYLIRQFEAAKGLPRCRIIALTGLSTESDMQAALGENGQGPMDSWLVKGHGKSLRIVIDEVVALQQDITAAKMTTTS